MTIECIRLTDNSLSVRIEGNEVSILPPRNKCTYQDLEAAMREIRDYVREKVEQECEHDVEALRSQLNTDGGW